MVDGLPACVQGPDFGVIDAATGGMDNARSNGIGSGVVRPAGIGTGSARSGGGEGGQAAGGGSMP
jgi:hypothetical protein